MKSHYHVKHAFSNLLISSLIMLILPIIFIIILCRLSFNMAENDCVNVSKITLNQIETVMSQKLKALDNIAMQFNIFDSQMQMIFSISRPNPGEASAYDITVFSKLLDNKFANYNNYYIRYQLISKDNDMVYYNNAVTNGIEFYYNQINGDSTITYETWYQQIFSSNTRTLLPCRQYLVGHSPMSAITYNYPFNQFGKKNKIIGVLQFIIPEDYLINIDESEASKADFYLLNKSGNTIYCTNSNATLPSDVMNQFTENAGSFSISDTKQMLVYRKSTHMDLVLAAVYDKSVVLASAQNIRQTGIAAILVIIIVELTLAFWISYRNAIPIHNFANNLKNLLMNSDSTNEFPIKPEHSEYDYLDHGIKTLQSKQDILSTMAIEKKTLQKRMFLDQLFEGRFKDEHTILSLAKEVDLSLSAALYYVITISTKSNAVNLESLYADHASSFLVISHDYEPDIIALILLFDSINSTICNDFIMEYIKELKEAINTDSIAFGISKSTQSVADIVFCYRQARYCQRLVDKNDKIISYEDIIIRKETLFYPQELENNLINAVKYREKEKITKIFETIKSKNFIERKLSNAVNNLLLSNLESTLFKLYHELLSEDRIDKTMSSISQYTSHDQIIACIESEFLVLASRSEELRSSRSQQLCDSISDYLQTNYMRSELSLALISEYFNFSESYFSQYYKDSFGESFSTTLENIRLQHAKELILQNNYEIEEISVLVGYNNSTTFRRAFKRNFGCSPSVYKTEKR